MSDDPERPGSATAAADCGDVEAMLDAYALDALDPAETAEVVAHLARCADCRARLTRSERSFRYKFVR